MKSSTLRKFNTFIMFKLPVAWLSGVRIKEIADNRCRVGVKHRWINQNPFNSMYFAVQAMAAELSTGALVMAGVRQSGRSISMLVKKNEALFSKKATGRISFECRDGHKVVTAVKETLESGEGQTFWMESTGVNQAGEEVSHFRFEWSIKEKSK